ncbi:DUF4232 domain-containing protein [Streptomyces massasporeus]|uniref:DUF4232 domain-containing protein n=1 Tax=Streptomyces massasporeus TaxID=67324 RepID=UPI0037BBBE75
MPNESRATTTLWRPTGATELDLVRDLDWRARPPRLPEQPIFYPVLDEDYAIKIARDWQAKQATENRQASKAAKSGKDTKDGKGAAATRVPCNGCNTTVTAQPVRRPLNHMLITVKNTGSKLCDLTYYPVLRFDEMECFPQAVEDSQPQAVTTLPPASWGYAGVSLSAADGSGEGGTTGHKLTVGFQGYTPDRDAGPSAIPALPAKGVSYDSTLAACLCGHHDLCCGAGPTARR